MAGYNYWLPKAFGFRLNERWGKASFLIDALVRQAALRRARVLRLIATLPPGRPTPQSDMVCYHVTERLPARVVKLEVRCESLSLWRNWQ